MRWMKNKKYKTRKIHDERHIKKFLLFPKCINDETRWLEFVTILQKWTGIHWVDWEWIDKIK